MKDKGDPRLQYVKSLDPGKFRITDYPGGIFLCGGKADNRIAIPLSWRDAFERYIECNQDALSRPLLSAEQIVRRSFGGPYKDLFELEKHIAAISAAIVVIAESPGSFTELGAFSQIPEIRKKLLVVIDNDNYHAVEPGFIKLGPLQFLKNIDGESVTVETKPHYELSNFNSSIDTNLGELAVTIQERINGLHREQIFSRSESGHRMLLIGQLCYHMHALSFSELRIFSGLLGINLEREELKKYLHLLEKYEILKAQTRKGKDYYSCTNSRLLRFAQKRGEKIIDMQRARIIFAKYYGDIGDRRPRLK